MSDTTQNGKTTEEDSSARPRKPACQPEEEKEQPNKGFGERLKSIWTKAGLDIPTLLMMAKGGLSPTIALSIFQTDAISQAFPTLGYILGVVSVLGAAFMPRAKFVQTMLLDIIAVLLGTSLGMLESYSSVRARLTTPSSSPAQTTASAAAVATAQRPEYNSSASAVCAVWLFFQIYGINTFRAKFPQFAFPCIIFSILVNVTSSFAPMFPTVDYGSNFCKTLMEVFLLGLGIATGVHFVVPPSSTRRIAFKGFAGFLAACRSSLKLEIAYLQSLEDKETFQRALKDAKDGGRGGTPQCLAVKSAIEELQALHGKLHGDLGFAKREVALGKLGPKDLKQMYEMNRRVFLPLIGLNAIIGIFERLSELTALSEVAPAGGWDTDLDEIRRLTIADWAEYMKELRGTLEDFATVVDEGLEHVLVVLEFQRSEKKSTQTASDDDVEARADDTRPGTRGFAAYMETKMVNFRSGKEMALRAWADQRGFRLPADFFEDPTTATLDLFAEHGGQDSQEHQRKQRHLYMLLYIQYLLHACATRVHEYVKFADAARDSGKLSRWRLIYPGRKRCRKWFNSLWREADAPEHEDHTGADIGGNSRSIHLGSAYSMRKDPEHLPPTNALQRAGNYIRLIPAFLRSPESAFGFRAATATMSIGIVAFLYQTQHWFVQQRGLWALIMVSISMNPTAGSTIFSFLLRAIGTVIAMLASWCIWYISGQHTAGSLVLLWFFVACGLYVPLKKPQFTVVGMISCVTVAMIVGYQLQVRAIGVEQATSNGQPYYEIYEFAPYRLATVLVGLMAAFVWLVFPYPISEHSQIRKGLGGALYLLANYYSIVHELVGARVRGDEGDPDDRESPGYKLEKARSKVFSKSMLAFNGLKTYSNFVKWEVPIGGKFPKQEYDSIIQSVQS